MPQRRAIIIGAGPAGLTAAYELLSRTDIIPIVLEKSSHMGGLARTENYKGNRIDIGGHRFFSKSDRVMRWWLDRMPLQKTSEETGTITYQGASRPIAPFSVGLDPEETDLVMLVRRRKSRIYFLRQFFEYPLQFTTETLRKLGVARVIRIGASYARSALWPPSQVENLEQFFISRFGHELYRTFFKSYTEKVWGLPCDRISAEWGAQRIKGLSLTRALSQAIRKIFRPANTVAQKGVETSLIERFLYPKLGPGQLWEEVANQIRRMGGTILTDTEAASLKTENGRILSVLAKDGAGNTTEYLADFVFSTMPVKELVRGLDCHVPQDVRQVSEGLIYRDFIVVGLLLNKLAVSDAGNRLVADNWIYIQEPDALAGRLQIFNNWSPYLVSDPQKVWIGVEYFCNDTDELWRKPDSEMIPFAAAELEKIGIASAVDVVDGTVLRVPKTYPAYFGTYDRFSQVREYLDTFDNLFLIGRNGMHKYNNQDHSMLAAMTAVDNIVAGRTDKANLWAVNTEAEYHEDDGGS